MHVDSSSLGSSLSSHRQSYIGLVFSSHFIDLMINKIQTPLTLEPWLIYRPNVRVVSQDFLVRVDTQRTRTLLKGNRPVISSRLTGAQRVSFTLFSVIKVRKFEETNLSRLLDTVVDRTQVVGDPV
jgi:hypothetical protein